MGKKRKRRTLTQRAAGVSATPSITVTLPNRAKANSFKRRRLEREAPQ